MIINALDLAEIIIQVVGQHYNLLNFIVIDQNSVFILKFWLLQYYLLKIKLKLLTTFNYQTDNQTERQNSIIKAYFQVFINLSKIIRQGSY